MDAQRRRSRSRTPLERRRDIATDAVTNLTFKKPSPANVKQRRSPAQAKVKAEKEREKEAGITLSAPVALSLVDLTFMLSLVFGGCCTYVRHISVWIVRGVY